MRQIAFASLVHDRGKFLAALAGVSLAVMLVLVQGGLYAGFLKTSSAVIREVHGDVWVMAKGVHVFESAELLSPGSRALVASHPCVTGVRPLVLAWSTVRRSTGALETAMVLGYDSDGRSQFPWTLDRGLPLDLDGPARVAIDRGELAKLELPDDPIGATLRVGQKTVHVAALTRGIRAFTLTPYVFTTFRGAHTMLGLRPGATSFWIVDVRDQRCAADIVAMVNQTPDLQAMTADSFRVATEQYWVGGSGAGGAVAFSSMMALVVGAVIVGQTLFSITKEHEKELATLKAMGTTRVQLCAFVGWQVLLLAVVSTAIAGAMALVLGAAARNASLQLELTPAVFAVTAVATTLMCAIASAMSLRRLFTLDAGEIFR